MTPVVVSSPLYGDVFGIALRVTHHGVMVDMPYCPPPGTKLAVRFTHITEDDLVTELVAAGEVIEIVIAGDRRVVILRLLELVDDMQIAALRVMH